jgi:hypothetical protein
MSKLNLEDVLFICFGTAEATELPLEMPDLDNCRDAVVLIDAEVVDRPAAVCVLPEAPEDDVCKLDPSPGGARDGDWPGRTVLEDSFLPSGPNCESPFWVLLGTSVAP